VGLSPYLLIPHAALIHNEALVAQAEMGADEIMGARRSSFQDMERARRLMDRSLNRLLTPNVFNYETERTLFEGGAVARGSLERLRTTRRKLEELTSLIAALRARGRDNWQLAVNLLLILLVLLQVKDAPVASLPASVPTAARWGIFIGIYAVVALAYIKIRAWTHRWEGVEADR
jgi:hypothetical protein